MRDKIKIGLLGFGAMGRTHSYAVSTLDHYCENLPFKAEIAGLYSRTREKTIAAVETFRFGRAAMSEDELIYDPDIDVIDICTPNVCHYETLKKAIAAGKDVYCEKPLCISRTQADEIAHLAAEKNIVGGIVFNNRFLPATLRAKTLVDEGRIGRVLSFRARYLHSGCASPDAPLAWKQSRDICGGGVLFDLGSHIIDLLVWLCGGIASVSAKTQIAYPLRRGQDGKLHPVTGDEAFYMLATLENGACGTLEGSKISTGTNDELSIEIHGERGALKFDLTEPNWLWFYDVTKPSVPFGGERGFTRIECIGRYEAPAGGFPSPKASIGWLRGHVMSMCSFLSAVHARSRFSPSIEDGAYVQRVMEAAYHSDETGKWVDI